MKTRERSRSFTDLVPQPSLKQSKIEDFVLTWPLSLKTPAPFYLAAASRCNPLTVEGVSPRVENKGSSKTTAPNQSLNEPTLTELLVQQCFLVAETIASIQFQLDKIISTLNYLVFWATSGCPGVTAQQPDAAAGSFLPSLSKSTGQCNPTNSSNSTPFDANSHLSKQVALNINPINGNLPHWGSIQLARGRILQLLGLEADDLKKVELLPSPVYCTRVLLSFDNSSTTKLFFRRRSLLRSFGILPRRVFKDMSIKPLLSNRQLVSVRRFTAPKRPSAAHINVPILNAIPDTRPLINYTSIPVKPPDGVLSDSSLTVPPTIGQTNPPQQVTSYQEASLDFISWEQMAPKEATPAQGTQGSLVNKPQAIKSKLWSLSLPDKDSLGFQGVHTNLPAEAPLGLSPECLICKSEDPGLLQTPSADATECLPARQPINATSTNWSVLRALQPYEQGLPPLPPFLPLSPKRVTLPFNNGCIFPDLKGSLEKINHTE
ncbi:hypothetical protein E2320_002053 [Naja naja]|nr:hypothetical protein E2320_002053 [Naja naja]